jgi:hypothetical protein
VLVIRHKVGEETIQGYVVLGEEPKPTFQALLLSFMTTSRSKSEFAHGRLRLRIRSDRLEIQIKSQVDS